MKHYPRNCSDELRRIRSENLQKDYDSGKRLPYWQGRKFKKYHRLKISNGNKGKVRSDEFKLKLKEINLGNKNGKSVWFKSKELHPNWKGGLTEIQKVIRGSKEYRETRLKIFRRDRFKCQECGETSRSSNKINLHHKIPIFWLLDKYKIKSLEDSLKCKEMWDENNLITLCVKCHSKTDSYGRKYYKYIETIKTL